MVPFIIAGAVVISATAIAFMLDIETDEERSMQDVLRRRIDNLRNEFDDAVAGNNRAQKLKRREAAFSAAEYLRDCCNKYCQRLELPIKEFSELTSSLKNDLADISISPYRRNALRQLQARVEDTCNRLNAFQTYCDWYLNELRYLWDKERYDQLLNFDFPLSRLPEDWYYNGKVGLASVAELNASENRYGQILNLKEEPLGSGYSDSRQRAFLLQYPDQDAIPVQLFSKKNRRHFKACILRGALHVEHILDKIPCVAYVVRKYGEGYEIRCFPSFCSIEKQHSLSDGIKGFLPLSETNFPGKRYVPGEKLEVYLHHYDLLLSDSSLTVTQHRDSLVFAGVSPAPVFIHVDESEFDIYPLVQEAESGSFWQLRSCIESKDRNVIVLQLGAWQIEAAVSGDDNQLCMTAVTHTGFDTVQLEQLPFEIRIISQKFKDKVFCDVLQFQNFLQFCRQQSLFGADMQERKAAANFFDRWNLVTEYLLEKEGYQVFSLIPNGEPEDREWNCISTVNLNEVLNSLVEKNQSFPRLFLEEQFINRDGVRRWLQIGELLGVPDAICEGAFRCSHNGIQRPGSGQGFQQVMPAKLRIRYPNGGELANLTRQKRALQSFMNGRLVNLALKQILMMPQRYVAQPDPFWVQRVNAGLVWQDTNWQDPAKAGTAKSVLEAALTESNLYLIQGPPGTGKTTCIVELLYQIFHANPATRILVVSQQNAAVDNALERFLRRYPVYKENILRVSNDAAKVQNSLRPHVTDSILTSYLEELQKEYSHASIGEPARAAWIKEWIESVYRADGAESTKFDDELTELLIGDYKLVAATCVGLASRRYGMDRLVFDVCIIDEGGRSTVPELLIPMMRSRKSIIIGDHYQLPPSIARALREEAARDSLPFLEETFLDNSFFEQLYENLPPNCRGRLVEQYRMVEPIGDLIADLFYSQHGVRGLFNGKVHDRTQFFDPVNPIRWYNVKDGRQEKENGSGPSLLNSAEANAILNFLLQASQLLSARKHRQGVKFQKKTVAVITPYGAQKRLIIKLLRDNPTKQYVSDDVMDIVVDTVDSFQGSEADIVLYSTVRTAGDISFLLDRQRLNVACSRARENLIFFGAAKFLRERETRNKKLLFTTIMDRAMYEGDDQISQQKTKRQHSSVRVENS